MSSPSRPGAPRTSSRTPRRSSARTPRRGPTTGPIAKPQSRPGGPGSSRSAPKEAPRIDPSRPKGSWTAMLTWRAAVIACVLALAFAVLAPSVRAYMDQQVMLGGLRAEAAMARAEVDDLEADVARWDDPAFVVAQARERLAYVFPGETPYRVIDPESVTGPAEGSPAAQRNPDALAGASWYDRLWDSVVVAGETEPGAAELPAAPVIKVSPDPTGEDGPGTKVDSGA